MQEKAVKSIIVRACSRSTAAIVPNDNLSVSKIWYGYQATTFFQDFPCFVLGFVGAFHNSPPFSFYWSTQTWQGGKWDLYTWDGSYLQVNSFMWLVSKAVKAVAIRLISMLKVKYFHANPLVFSHHISCLSERTYIAGKYSSNLLLNTLFSSDSFESSCDLLC